MSGARKGEVPSTMEGVYGGRRYMGRKGKPGKHKRVGRRV